MIVATIRRLNGQSHCARNSIIGNFSEKFLGSLVTRSVSVNASPFLSSTATTALVAVILLVGSVSEDAELLSERDEMTIGVLHGVSRPGAQLATKTLTAL